LRLIEREECIKNRLFSPVADLLPLLPWQRLRPFDRHTADARVMRGEASRLLCGDPSFIQLKRGERAIQLLFSFWPSAFGESPLFSSLFGGVGGQSRRLPRQKRKGGRGGESPSLWKIFPPTSLRLFGVADVFRREAKDPRFSRRERRRQIRRFRLRG